MATITEGHEPRHDASVDGSISQLASTVDHSFFEPLSFFVSWQGVLTLAYKGFPPALDQYKQRINSACPELPKENPGSKWPKTSLGALKDHKRLTPENLSALMKTCRLFQAALSNAGRVLVDHLTLVMYKSRSLEMCIERTLISLNPHKHVDNSEASQLQQNNVNAVLQEADDPSYWVSASKDGNRESHYRGVALGCTLVADLSREQIVSKVGNNASNLLQIISAFRDEVENALPGMYSWFDNSSLHVTIRAVMG